MIFPLLSVSINQFFNRCFFLCHFFFLFPSPCEIVCWLYYFLQVLPWTKFDASGRLCPTKIFILSVQDLGDLHMKWRSSTFNDFFSDVDKIGTDLDFSWQFTISITFYYTNTFRIHWFSFFRLFHLLNFCSIVSLFMCYRISKSVAFILFFVCFRSASLILAFKLWLVW